MKTHKEQNDQTRQKIINGLVAVGHNKTLNQISISDITRHCNINRGTFYLHYLDKDDLIQSIRQELLHQAAAILKKQMPHTMDPRYIQQGKPYPVIIQIAQWMLKNQSLLCFWLGPNGDSRFRGQLDALVKKAIEKELLRTKGSDRFLRGFPDKYALNLVINDLMATLILWLNNDTESISVEEIAKIIMQSLYFSPYKLLGLSPQKKKHP